MGKFLLGFVIGVGLGAGVALLLTPEPGSVRRERLRTRTEMYASGGDTPLGTVASAVQSQRDRLEVAVEAGRRASAARQAELWAQLELTPPAAPTEPPASGHAQIV